MARIDYNWAIIFPGQHNLAGGDSYCPDLRGISKNIRWRDSAEERTRVEYFMKEKKPFILFIGLLAAITLACQGITGFTTAEEATPTIPASPTPIPTALPAAPVQVGEANPDEPIFISGSIPYTSPFFLRILSEPFVLLEDQAGFVQRDKEFEFDLAGQSIGPVAVHEDNTLTYSLSLPSVPQGTLLDVDNNGVDDKGVQIFAVAYWDNTWGGPFLEPRDGTGWSTAYASTITDPEQENEIIGGILVVWAPDDQQGFPTGFGEDGLLFTEDDPTAPIEAGYTLVDLNQEPFEFYKEAQPVIELNEGVIALNDYSDLSYQEAFEAMFEKVSREYPFTAEKEIEWQALYDEYAPRVASARNPTDFYRAVRDFTYAIPDKHVGLTLNPEVFFAEQGGSFGLVLAELSDGRVIVTQVLPNTPGSRAGIQVGAEIITWQGQPVGEAISQVNPYIGPYSTEHHKRLEQLIFLTRQPPNSQVTITFQNPGESEPTEATLVAEVEYDSLFAALPSATVDDLAMPVEARVLPDSGLGYIRVISFLDDTHLMAQLWDRYIQGLIDTNIPGLIIDVRINGGGSGSLALDFAGYFFDEEVILSRGSYYNDLTKQFEYLDRPSRIRPAPSLYEGPIAVLISPSCISACEGFANAMIQGGRAFTVGHYPSAGAFGEVGRGQYKLPEELSLQFPTGRPETLDGQVLIEGQGVPLDISVPVTEASALGQADPVLEAAIQALREGR